MFYPADVDIPKTPHPNSNNNNNSSSEHNTDALLNLNIHDDNNNVEIKKKSKTKAVKKRESETSEVYSGDLGDNNNNNASRKYTIRTDIDSLPARTKLLLAKLKTFYSDGKYERIVLPILNDRNPVALRDLDWCCVNYSAVFPIIYKDPKNLNGPPFNMHEKYILYDNTFKKKLFDVFQRGERIHFSINGVQHETTIAQLNFFMFAIEYGVIDWVAAHKKEIRAHHKASKDARQKEIAAQPNREKKRQRLVDDTNMKSGCLVIVQPMKISIRSSSSASALENTNK